MNTKIKVHDFVPPGKLCRSVCVIAGVHGNEPAGSLALLNLLVCRGFKRISDDRRMLIRVIPIVNPTGLLAGTREDASGRDLNRGCRQLAELTAGFDWVLDLHEGWGFHQIQPSSIGSTISPSRDLLAEQAAQYIAAAINLTRPVWPFLVLRKIGCDIESALSCVCEKRHQHYLLIETTGQRDIQPIRIRIMQATIGTMAMLDFVAIADSS